MTINDLAQNKEVYELPVEYSDGNSHKVFL